MKKIASVIIAMLLCLTLPVMCYADNIYIVEDEEDEFVPQIPTTTTKPAETTTVKTESIFGDTEGLDDLFSGFTGIFGDGIDSIFSGFGDIDFDFGGNEQEDAGNEDDGLQPMNPGEAETVKPAITTSPDTSKQDGQASQGDAGQHQQGGEIPSIVIVNQGNTSDDRISGSTLTLLVFVAAIVIIILAGAIVLVIMTKRTEYNSSVRSRSTLPGVEQPGALAQFLEDDIKDDGKDYGNINYWENE